MMTVLLFWGELSLDVQRNLFTPILKNTYLLLSISMNLSK